MAQYKDSELYFASMYREKAAEHELRTINNWASDLMERIKNKETTWDDCKSTLKYLYNRKQELEFILKNQRIEGDF